MTERPNIGSVRYLENYEAIPSHIRWTRGQIERSMRETMSARPETGDLWIFAYGSLIWNPACQFETRRKATMFGWHRSLCLKLIAGRGSAQSPGRMLSLEPGGITEGVALKLPASTLEDVLPSLWIREMPTGAYRPTWSPVIAQDGTRLTALVFVAERDHVLYEPNASVACVSNLVASAKGPLGTNAEYVLRLKEALDHWDISDRYVDELVSAIMRLQTQSLA